MEESDKDGFNIKLEPIEIKEDIEILDDEEVRDSSFKPKNKESAMNEIGNIKDHIKDKPVKGKRKKDKVTTFNCKLCPFSASTKSQYTGHLKTHKTNTKKAKASPEEEEKESAHYTAIMDGEIKAYKCTICGKVAKEKYLIRRHIWVHTGQFPMTCVLCKAKIRLKKSMKFHLKKEHNLEVRIRDIENDGKLKQDIKEYQKKSVENNDQRAPSEKLDASTGTVECLNSTQVKPPDESNNPTPTDDTKKLPTGDDRYITVKNGRFFQCVICHKNWQTKGGFNTHFARHMKKLPYSCEICGHKGGTKKIIKNHMRRSHKVHISTFDIPDMASEPESEEEDNTTNSILEIVGAPYATIEGNRAVKCKVCNRIFDGKHQFGWHYTRHKKEFPYSCDECLYRSKDESYLKSHMETRHPKNMQNLKNDSDNSNGSKLHPSPSNEIEARLQENPESRPSANVELEGNEYVITETANGAVYKCLLCKKEFKHRGRFNLHFAAHQEEFPYSCKQCSYRTREKTYLKQHFETRHNVVIQLEHIEADNFDNHESSKYIVVRSGGRRHFKCRICGELRGKPWSFNKHYLLHPQGGLYSCNSCDYKATERRFLRQHLQIKHNIVVEWKNSRSRNRGAVDASGIGIFSCVVCGETFKSQILFNKHQLIHSDDRPYDCPHCMYKSKSKYTLKTHLCRRHRILLDVIDIHPTKTSDGSETIVEQEFQDTDANTIQTQTSSKMFKCESCNFTCSVSATLTKHRKRVHNLIQKFSCRVCRKTFKSPYELNAHNLIHVDERSYSCPHCWYKGKSKHLLKAHLLGMHNLRLNVKDTHPAKTSVSETTAIQTSVGNELVPVINHNIYKCEQCPLVSVTKEELLEHGESHFADDKSSINGCTLDSPEFVTVKNELSDNCNDVNI